MWNTDNGVLELVGKPKHGEDVTLLEVKQYFGWLLGTFASTKRFQDKVLSSANSANTQNPCCCWVLLGWEAKWSLLPQDDRERLTNFGLVPSPRAFYDRICLEVHHENSAMYKMANS